MADARSTMSLFSKQREYYERLRAQLDALCPPEEPLLGAVIAANKRFLQSELFGVGVTPQRMVLQPLDKRQQPKGEPRWITKADIVNCAIWGEGGGFREWIADDSEFELRFETATEHYKFGVVGGWTMSKAMGDDYLAGIDAVVAFLQSSRLP
jgi:hypothetical protein